MHNRYIVSQTESGSRISEDNQGLAGKHGIETENLDLSVSPGKDFYNYACGGWQQKHPLPEEFASYGTFTELSEKARMQLKDLIQNLSDNPDSKIKGTDAQKVCDIYSLCMDETRLNSEGAQPLRPFLEKIRYFRMEEFAETIAWLQKGITSVFFSGGVGVDSGNSEFHIWHVTETGLGLGDRDYYLENDENTLRIRDAYETYVRRLMELIGYDSEAQQRVWENVITIETELAKHKMTREERRDPLLSRNVRTIDELENLCGSIDWDKYFNALGVKVEKVNVTSVRYMEFLNGYLPTLSRRQIEDYMVFSLVTDSSGLLSDDFHNANFELYGRVMSGTKEMKPRWKRAMDIANSMFGEIVGKLYVEKYFPEQNKKYMTDLVENLRKALGRHINELQWMSAATKEKALEKLRKLNVKIGYPDIWKDYSGISVDPSKSYQENVYEASLWFTRDNYDKLDRPVDKSEWHMNPQTVNAYYSPLNNEICFPAGILQPPYFDLAADDACNYGGIGVVIGHEMTHGFDDQGRHFDMDGNLNEWWLPEDAAEFNQLADRLAAQFDAVEVAPGVHANGRYTLGENIADQGGLRVALTAYLDSRNGEKPEMIDGFSPLQRFYLSYAGVWASNIRDEEILERTKTDPHSLGRNRVNVTLKNISPFMEAFDIRPSDEMYRPEEERIVIW